MERLQNAIANKGIIGIMIPVNAKKTNIDA